MSQFYRDKWHEIHSNAAKVADKRWTHREFCDWAQTIPGQLPCGSCRRHARDYIDRSPPDEADDALRWTLDFHNDVNLRLRKPLFSYSELKKKYDL